MSDVFVGGSEVVGELDVSFHAQYCLSVMSDILRRSLRYFLRVDGHMTSLVLWRSFGVCLSPWLSAQAGDPNLLDGLPSLNASNAPVSLLSALPFSLSLDEEGLGGGGVHYLVSDGDFFCFLPSSYSVE